MSGIQKYFAAVERIEDADSFEEARGPLVKLLKELGLALVNSDGYVTQQLEAEHGFNTATLNGRGGKDPFTAVSAADARKMSPAQRVIHYETLIAQARLDKKNGEVDPAWERELARAREEAEVESAARKSVRARKAKKSAPRRAADALMLEVERLRSQLGQLARRGRAGGGDYQEVESALFMKEAELERAEAELGK